MQSTSNRKVWSIWVAVLVVVLGGSATRAKGDDVRTFAVSVDGKPVGTHVLSVAVSADGTETIAATADVKVKLGLITQSFELRSLEVWKNSVLTSVESRSNFGGTMQTLKGAAGEGGFAVTVNKQTHRLGRDVISAAGGRLPTWDKIRDVVFLDLDDGSGTPVRVEPLGSCRVMLNGQPVEGFRYKLTGKDVNVEWWFDRQHGRAIRQEIHWQGHVVVLELTAIKR